MATPVEPITKAEPTEPETPKTPEAPETPETPDALGDAGKKAIKAERDARKAAEDRIKELEAEAARLRRSNAATKGTDLEAIKQEIRAEYTDQLRASAIRAEAKGRLSDPGDTARYPEYFKDVDASDDAAVKAAVDKLLTEKPYLAAEQTSPNRWGDVGGGQRTTPETEPTSPEERMRRAYGKAK